ncbi:MAG: hypothetical protein GX855_10815 [Firmicutes bacterium]|nr:hypothetical protein [Bacillota bacterium]
MRKPAVLLTYILIAGYLLLIGGAFYWQIGQREVLVNHPSNPYRLREQRSVQRGGIFDSSGEVIAESVRGEKGLERVFRGTSGLASTIGYFSQRYGTAGLEKTLDEILMGRRYPGTSVIGRLRHLLSERTSGYDVITSIDLDLQRTLERALGNRKGAAVVMEVKTGRILAVASLPGFNPEEVDTQWDRIASDPNSPLYNRALAGFYPPGSTFKIVVLAAALAQGELDLASVFDDPGYVTIQGHQIANAGGTPWGRISLLDALVVSSNTVFAEVARRVGSDQLLQMAGAFGLGRRPPLAGDNVGAGKLPSGPLSPLELAQMAIGQYGIVATPLQMAMVVQAIANDGLMMEPMVVDAVKDGKDGSKWVNRPRPMGYVISVENARKIRQAMAEVVSRGTGRNAALSGIDVAGKTGSAENPQGRAHAWFVGMAPVDKPVICLAVIVEHGGSGGSAAAPIARRIFAAYFQGAVG